MIRVCVAFPSAAPMKQARACLEAWRDMGYSTAILVDDAKRMDLPADIKLLTEGYRGYAASVNLLSRNVLNVLEDCQIIVAAGDDVYPDPDRQAHEIGAEFIEHFDGTLGVMQPQGHDSWAHRARTLAWSPWLGRAWCQRAYQGHGPLYAGYHHVYVDQELYEVANRLGLYWERPDIMQFHDTWKIKPELIRPQHLEHVPTHVEADRALYEERETAGFPGMELL